MRVWIVTSKATESESSGIVLRAIVRCHGIYTSYSRAHEISQKFRGVVIGMFLDAEESGTLEQWDNPGVPSA